MKKTDVKKIVAKNHLIDSEVLSEVIELINGLRKNGIKGSSYNITPPFGSNFQRKNHSKGQDTF